MKAITISQPYASLIASGAKFVENRTWSTDYRGLLAIHAGKGTQYLDKSELQKYPTGCVIAIARLVHVRHIKDIVLCAEKMPNAMMRDTTLTFGVLADHKHTEGPWCWILENVRQIEPVPCRGGQGLWVWHHPQFVEGEL